MMASNAGTQSPIDFENQPNRNKFSDYLEKSKLSYKKVVAVKRKVEDSLKSL